MICATLVTGSSPARREAAIAIAIMSEQGLAAPGSSPLATDGGATEDRLDGQPIAVLLEGLPSGKESTPLAALAHSQPLTPIRISRIASGCLCCTGNLTMRVTLNRVLRERPRVQRLFVGIDQNGHTEKLRQILQMPPYDDWLTLTADLVAG